MDTNVFGPVAVIILGVGSLVVISICGYYMLRACLLFGVFVEHGENDSALATRKFLELLDQAEHSLIIYDDGDPVEDSIYNSKKIISAFESLMRSQPQLVVRVLFNKRTSLSLPSVMCQQFGDRFQIRYREGDRPNRDIHFKIADDALGYFSEHKLGDMKRDFHYYDARHASERARSKAFGNHVQYFDKHFEGAAA